MDCSVCYSCDHIRIGMTAYARLQLYSVAKLVAIGLILSLLTSRPNRIDADAGITPQAPEKCTAGGALAIEDLTVTPPYYGNRVSERKYLAVLNQETYVLSDIPLAEGILKRFFVYLQKPLEGGTGAEPSPNAKAMLQIWRPENAISSELNRVYTLVYSIPVGLNASIGPNGTMSTYLVNKFVTVSGDVMGFTVDHDAPLPISCGRNRTREVLILAFPKNVQLTEEYDFPQKTAQRLACAMAVEVVHLNACALCRSRKDLQTFAKHSRPQDLPEEVEQDQIVTASSTACMEGSLSCGAVAGIIGGILGIAVISLVILGVVQYQRLREEMKRPSDFSPSSRRKT